MSTNGEAGLTEAGPTPADAGGTAKAEKRTRIGRRTRRTDRRDQVPDHLPNRQTMLLSAGLLAAGILIAVLGLTVFADDADQPGSLSTGYAVAVLAAIGGGAGLVMVARLRQAFFGQVRRTVSELEDRADDWLATGTPTSLEPTELELRAKRMRNHLLDSGDVAEAERLTSAIRAMRDIRIGRYPEGVR
jgi:hypothetical protein